jgi:hypothetical protein
VAKGGLMAGTSNYKLLIEGQLTTEKIQLRLEELRKQTKLILNFEVDQKDMGKVNEILESIRSKGGTIGKIKLFEDDKGGVSKAIIEYKNEAGQIEKITRDINTGVKVTKERYVDLARVESESLKIEKDRLVLTAKQADEMAKAALNADKFLARSKNMQQTPQVQAAVGIAQKIKIESVAGNIEEVRKLSNQLDIAKASFSNVTQGIRSWTAGMAQSLKSTIQYAASVGLLYGALNQLKQGIQYIKDLNKEMVNIQMVTGQSDREINKLAVGYNKLGKEMSVSTLDIAKGSLEFIRQGKSAEETAILIKNATMMSKLGNMEAAESSEALTSIMNGFKLEASETGDVVNKLVSIKFVETHSDMWTDYDLDIK